jgi:hypothetical protein
MRAELRERNSDLWGMVGGPILGSLAVAALGGMAYRMIDTLSTPAPSVDFRVPGADVGACPPPAGLEVTPFNFTPPPSTAEIPLMSAGAAPNKYSSLSLGDILHNADVLTFKPDAVFNVKPIC